MFSRARLKLTAFYTATVLLLVLFFSAGLVVFFDLDLFGAEIAPEGDHFNLSHEFEAATDRKMQTALLIIDPTIILLTLGVGWFLAGKTLKPLQENVKKQKRFVSDAAHELRTPLSIMKAGLETIDIGTRPSVDDYRDLNLELRDEIARMVELTNDLLFLSRDDAAIEPVAREEVDVTYICSNNLNLLGAYAQQNGVYLRHEVESGLHCLGDEQQIGRLLINLLKNSIDYNREGGEVVLRAFRSGRKIVLEVSDTGIGISQNDLEHVFERFYKADDSRERSKSGTGLGLSIVKAIVRNHEGDIDVESRIGEGTTVTVTLNAVERRTIFREETLTA